MQPPPGVIVVPGFTGFARVSGAGGSSGELGAGAATRLERLWLMLLEERDPYAAYCAGEEPDPYLVVAPEETILSREFPPDPGLEALVDVLEQTAEREPPHCLVYDWRRDLVSTATRLGEELAELGQELGTGEFDVIGIGPGCLVVRYLLESGLLPHAARLVRRVVLVAAPGHGVPAGLLLLSAALAGKDPEAELADVAERFPAALQLLPPRGRSYLRLESPREGFLEPFAVPEALAVARAGEPPRRIAQSLLKELERRNAVVHERLAMAYHPSWRRTLVVASASEPSYCELSVKAAERGLCWSRVERWPASGDGVMPILGVAAHPGLASLLVRGSHQSLCGQAQVVERVQRFLATDPS